MASGEYDRAIAKKERSDDDDQRKYYKEECYGDVLLSDDANLLTVYLSTSRNYYLIYVSSFRG